MVFVRRSFFKATPLIWAIQCQNNESYRNGNLHKKFLKIPTFEKIETAGGLERLEWFPTFYRFLVMKASIKQVPNEITFFS